MTICFVTGGNLWSQNNLHYSQYYNAPMYTNPALTGQLGQDLYRLNAHSRRQWSGTSSDDYMYTTSSGGMDLNLMENKLGIGLYALVDKAGGGIFNTMQIMPTLSYSFIMGDNTLSFGGQYVYCNSTLDGKDFKWGKGITPEMFNLNTNYSDVNAGINYKFDLFFLSANIGVAVDHLLRPKQSFLKSGPPSMLDYRYKLYTDFNYDMTDKLRLTPGFFGSFEASATNFVFGSNVSYKLIEGGKNGNRIIGGLWFRTNNGNLESIIPKFGTQMNKLTIMASYDWNGAMSSFGSSDQFEGKTNTIEISLIFTGKPKLVKPLLEDDYILNPRY